MTIITDHRPLISLFSHKNPSSKQELDLIYVYTNADALSRIQIDILKRTILTCNEENISRKLLPNTRSMKAKKNFSPETSDISQKRHELHIWECVSISDENNMCTLLFLIVVDFGQIKKINDYYIMGIYDNPACLDMTLEKLITYMYK